MGLWLYLFDCGHETVLQNKACFGYSLSVLMGRFWSWKVCMRQFLHIGQWRVMFVHSYDATNVGEESFKEWT